MENVCPHCQTQISQNFCPNCGEKKHSRITMKNVVGDFVSNIASIEGPVLKTIKDLSLRPGSMIKEYISGNRKIYYKPFQYYLLATTIYFLFFILWGDQTLEMFNQLNSNYNTTASAEELSNLQQSMNDFQNKNMRLFTFALVPLYSIFIWVFFKNKSSYSFTETFVVSLYILAQNLLFGIIASLFTPIHPSIPILLNFIFIFLYLPWVLYVLFDENLIKTILKSIAIIIIVFILYAIVMSLISLVCVIIFTI